MKAENLRVGSLVYIVDRNPEKYRDAEGNVLPEGVQRVVRVWTPNGYKQPWIELEDIPGAFRAKALELRAY